MNFNDTTSIFVKDLFRLRKVGSKPKDESKGNSVFGLLSSSAKEQRITRQASSVFKPFYLLFNSTKLVV